MTILGLDASRKSIYVAAHLQLIPLSLNSLHECSILSSMLIGRYSGVK
jgi:hypothetical protein